MTNATAFNAICTMTRLYLGKQAVTDQVSRTIKISKRRHYAVITVVVEGVKLVLTAEPDGLVDFFDDMVVSDRDHEFHGHTFLTDEMWEACDGLEDAEQENACDFLEAVKQAVWAIYMAGARISA